MHSAVGCVAARAILGDKDSRRRIVFSVRQIAHVRLNLSRDEIH
jgi:hypothetical protein